jgi:hypothetical protein
MEVAGVGRIGLVVFFIVVTRTSFGNGKYQQHKAGMIIVYILTINGCVYSYMSTSPALIHKLVVTQLLEQVPVPTVALVLLYS